MSIQEKAQEALTYLCEVNGRVLFTLERTPPQWLREAVDRAHGGLLPNDAVFRSVYELLELIAEGESPEEAVSRIADQATESDLLKWVDGYPYAPDDIDEAVESFGYGGFYEAVSGGYRLYLQEIADAITAAKTGQPPQKRKNRNEKKNSSTDSRSYRKFRQPLRVAESQHSGD